MITYSSFIGYLLYLINSYIYWSGYALIITSMINLGIFMIFLVSHFCCRKKVTSVWFRILNWFNRILMIMLGIQNIILLLRVRQFDSVELYKYVFPYIVCTHLIECSTLIPHYFMNHKVTKRRLYSILCFGLLLLQCYFGYYAIPMSMFLVYYVFLVMRNTLFVIFGKRVRIINEFIYCMCQPIFLMYVYIEQLFYIESKIEIIVPLLILNLSIHDSNYRYMSMYRSNE